jgi:hypothetical protein
MIQGEGHAGVDAMVVGVQEWFAGLRFRRSRKLNHHDNRLCFSGERAPRDPTTVASGTDSERRRSADSSP